VTRPWQTLATVPTREGALELRRRGDDEFLIVIAGRVLMTSAARRSEEALSTLALAKVIPARRILIGGLGMGFTLRAALDQLPEGARVDVAELNPDVVAWCRGPMASLTASAVSDPRVTILVDDVAKVITAAPPATYDAILLDLYEGPNAATQTGNDPFYGTRALARSHAALRPGGVLAVWSEDPDAAFAKRLTVGGFTVETHREGRGGRTHVVYLGVRET
jgi:spermidine synthase